MLPTMSFVAALSLVVVSGDVPGPLAAPAKCQRRSRRRNALTVGLFDEDLGRLDGGGDRLLHVTLSGGSGEVGGPGGKFSRSLDDVLGAGGGCLLSDRVLDGLYASACGVEFLDSLGVVGLKGVGRVDQVGDGFGQGLRDG